MQRFGLRLFCLSLHVLLVLGHLGLLVVWRVHAEYNIVFDVHLQSSVSLFVTALATALGTVYFAILLYFTQMLALHRNWQAGKTLTATHDNATAWVGLGSALVTMLDQIAVTSSVLGVLSIFGYLASLSLLHITTPALFSVEAFNITIPTTVSTQGFPQINTALDPDGSATREFVPRVVEFLPWIDHIPHRD
ncbi:hypothetical protein B0H13DRAFT_669902 [Mycena leptocephala]|nr:hypothetical protein B0H13DRAFT_669902 [Mycena leptocephala]